MLSPRPYQVEAHDAVWDRLVRRGEKSTLVVLPTGTGKTVLFGMLARSWLRDRVGRVLVLAHREELIRQAKSELDTIIGQPAAIEMAEERAVVADSGRLWDDVSPVVVASVQTLTKPARLIRFHPDEFGLIVTDEAHHATASSYRRIFEYFSHAKHLGVTATPQRADKFALGSVYDSVAYQMGISEAVEGGWLVPVEQRFVVVKDMDLSAVGTVGDDFAQGQLGHVLTGDRVLDQMVAATIALCGSEPTLVFTAPRGEGDTVSQGEVFADALNRIKPESAVFLSGETHSDDRRRELAWFEEGRRQYLVGCALFTEGFNCPKISRVVMARPTKSVVYYTQAIGRGTRTLRGVLTPDLDTPSARAAAIAASAKPSVLVIDFVGNSGRHKLVSAVDIFAGNRPPEVVTRAKEKATQMGVNARPVHELLREAEHEKEVKRQKKPTQARFKVNRVDLHQEVVNPFTYTDGGYRHARRVGRGPATIAQREWIESHGGVLEKEATAAEAGAMINEIKRRWSEGLCSPKQERVLRRFRLCDGPVPKAHAKALIDWLVLNNWKATTRPTRADLSILQGPHGFRLGIRVDGVARPVGDSYPTPDEVRRAYHELAASPQLT